MNAVISRRIFTSDLCCSKRHISVNFFQPHSQKCEEIKIPVPWGHLAAKWWGNQNVRPILGLHGWKDNSGTFDTLAPLLPQDVGFLAIDWPGHGFSSHYPPGINYHMNNATIVLQYVFKYFQWRKMSIIGHSIGSAAGFMYAATYPQNMDFLIGIDLLIPIGVKLAKLAEIYSQDVERFLVVDQAIRSETFEPIKYTYEEAVELKCKDTYHSIPKEFAHYFLQRSLQQCEDKEDLYYFIDDPRLECTFPPWSLKQMMYFGQKVSCPVFNIKAKGSPYLDQKESYMAVLKEIKRHSPEVRITHVDGTHHTHLVNSAMIIGKINDFIMKYNIKDDNEVLQQLNTDKYK